MNLKNIIFGLFLAIIALVGIISLNNPVLAQNSISSKLVAFNETSQTSSLIADADHSKDGTKESAIEPVSVRDNIYMLIGEGGNIGLFAGEKENIIIDSQFPNMTEKIVDAINKINPKPIKYLINTHYHFDHTQGNENMAKLGAVIIAHNNARKQMLVNHSYPVLGGLEIPASPALALPVITFGDTLEFNVDKEKIELFHIPSAHTDGDIVVYFPKHNVIHVGDTLFNGFYPFIDADVGGSIAGMIRASEIIISRCNDETLIIPGHGKLSNKAEFIEFRNMLSIVNERVTDAIRKKMSLEDIIKANLLEDLNSEWEDGPINSKQLITVTYQGLISSSDNQL